VATVATATSPAAGIAWWRLNFTEMIFDTPRFSIVTPYSTLAAPMVWRLWVMTMN